MGSVRYLENKLFEDPEIKARSESDGPESKRKQVANPADHFREGNLLMGSGRASCR